MTVTTTRLAKRGPYAGQELVRVTFELPADVYAHLQVEHESVSAFLRGLVTRAVAGATRETS